MSLMMASVCYTFAHVRCPWRNKQMNIVYVVVYDKLLLYAIRSRVRFCRQQRLSLNRMTEWQFQIVITAQGVIIEKFWQMFPWLFKKAFYFSFRLNYTTLEYTQAGQKNKQNPPLTRPSFPLIRRPQN